MRKKEGNKNQACRLQMSILVVVNFILAVSFLEFSIRRNVKTRFCFLTFSEGGKESWKHLVQTKDTGSFIYTNFIFIFVFVDYFPS